MADLTVIVCTHHYVVRNVSARARPVVERFVKRYLQYGLVREHGRFFRKALRVFAAATQDRSEYRLHINTLREFKECLEAPELSGATDLVEWVEIPIGETDFVEYRVHPHLETRDYQIPVVEYLEKPPPPRSKLVGMQTGKGKSYCALRAIANLQMRACIIVRPMYLEKWVIDIRKTYQIEDSEFLVVQGSAQLQTLLNLADAGELTQIKLVLISNKTLQNWIKLYEQHGDATTEMGYACTPAQLFMVLRTGFRLIDEVHQDFHLNFKIDLYSHVYMAGSLSATMVSDDDFINKMYEVAYPSVDRQSGPAYDQYIDARAIIYGAKNPEKIRTTEYGSKSYSHHAFEKSIMRHPPTCKNYMDLIHYVIENTFMKDYEPGQRLLVYAASINFCTLLTEYLAQKYPRLYVRRYVEEDPYDNLLESDIRVTTLQSAGTAVDILNLTTVILTPAVSSSAANIQGFGRLRKLPDGTTPQFLYFVCRDIPKHLEYHKRKRDILASRALTYREEEIPKPI